MSQRITWHVPDNPMLENWQTEHGVQHIRYHGGDAETELMELELGYNVAFALFHADDLLVNGLL